MGSNHKLPGTNLTDRQRKFAELYFQLGNASEAAEQAGFKRAYAQAAKRQPSVQAYLAELRKQMPAQPLEIINFLTGIMRGTIKASQLRTDAAIQLGIRAGLWKNEASARLKLEQEVATNE